jgi:hypothetical protein
MTKRPGLKWLLFSIGLLLFALCLTGCSVNAQFVDAVDEAWTLIHPEYVAYVNADATLDGTDKRARLRTAQILTATINEAKK